MPKTSFYHSNALQTGCMALILAAGLTQAAETPALSPEQEAAALRERLRQLEVQTRTPPRSETPGGIPTIEGDLPPGNDDTLWQLKREDMHFFGGGINFRNRNGEEGLDQLFEARIPLEVSFNTGVGRLNLELATVFLTSGDLSTSEFVNRYYGQQALQDPEDRAANSDDDVGGMEVAVGYSVGGFNLKIGTTPLGFEETNGVGEISFKHTFTNGFNFSIGGAIEPVTDSVLSYSGITDPVSGETWGGITKSGGTVSIGFDAGDFGLYLDFTSAVYSGENVNDNDFQQFNTGLYFYPYQSQGFQVASGLNITAFGFEENLRYFTYGHGGYFSPEEFLSASIPLRLSYTEDKLTVAFDFGIGLQYFSEEEAVFYPSDDALQQELEATELVQPTSFPGNSESELATRGGADINYQLTQQFSATARLSFSDAADYKETNFFMGVEYRFGKGD